MSTPSLHQAPLGAPPAAPAAVMPTGQAPPPPEEQAQTSTPVDTTIITSVASDHTKGKKVDVQSSYAALIAGLKLYYQPGDVFVLKAGTFTRDEIIARVMVFIQAAEQTKTDYKVWRGDVQTEKAVLAQVKPIRQGVRRTAEARFGEDGIQLENLGYKPRQPPRRKAETTAAAVVKAEATRKKRGTRGKVQRESIKGDVVGVILTPVTQTLQTAAPTGQQAPAQPSAVPAAAPAAPAPGAPGRSNGQAQ